MEIDQISQNLFKNDTFNREIKSAFERFYSQKLKNQTYNVEEEKSKDNFGNQLFLNEKLSSEQDQHIQIMQGRYSISSSVYSKRESRDSISSMTSNPFYQHMIGHRESGANLNQVTNQIVLMISELIKKQCFSQSKSSTPQNSVDNISDIIEKIEQIQKQQIKNVKKNLQEQIQKLKQDVQEQVISIIEKIKSQRKNLKSNKKSSVLKNQRKKVAQSILSISKNNQQMSTFSNIYDIGSILSDSEEENEEGGERNFQQLSQLSQKISSVQKSQTKITKQFQQKFLKLLEQNKKDVHSLTERIVEWKMKNEEKLEGGFTGVWNIVAEIQDRINKVSLKIQDLQDAYALKS